MSVEHGGFSVQCGGHRPRWPGPRRLFGSSAAQRGPPRAVATTLNRVVASLDSCVGDVAGGAEAEAVVAVGEVASRERAVLEVVDPVEPATEKQRPQIAGLEERDPRLACGGY